MNSYKLSRVAVEYLDRYYEILEKMKSDISRIDVTLTASCQFVYQSIAMNTAVNENAKNILRFTTYLPIEAFADKTKGECAEYEKAIGTVEGFCEIDKTKQKRLYLQSFDNLFSHYYNSVCKIVEDNNINLDYIRRSVALDRAIVRLCRTALRFSDCEQIRPAIDLMMNQSLGRIGELESIYRRIN
ncbi:MAG: hypothetical protein ACI4SB_08730 [Acutalibacteraceae bacterium]